MYICVKVPKNNIYPTFLGKTELICQFSVDGVMMFKNKYSVSMRTRQI